MEPPSKWRNGSLIPLACKGRRSPQKELREPLPRSPAPLFPLHGIHKFVNSDRLLAFYTDETNKKLPYGPCVSIIPISCPLKRLPGSGRPLLLLHVSHKRLEKNVYAGLEGGASEVYAPQDKCVTNKKLPDGPKVLHIYLCDADSNEPNSGSSEQLHSCLNHFKSGSG